ncbi:hypothetical protein Nepgr_002496 [Nepenthes gracilis]|uniref:Uncharacterized protein n=1 Tax=Nepenthes gracilis TaxID=150966 RepID=A0AAD3P760_NEPGR|nr:hypothetical protein Nepgr_002496 [Nepenthes gracilis]
MSMDFHPLHQTLLLVGTNTGDIGLRKVCSEEKLILQSFTVWDTSKCKLELKIVLSRDPTSHIDRVSWSADGSLFGLAYSKHPAYTCAYSDGSNIQQHFEIDAHYGGVTGLAIAIPMGNFPLKRRVKAAERPQSLPLLSNYPPFPSIVLCRTPLPVFFVNFFIDRRSTAIVHVTVYLELL